LGHRLARLERGGALSGERVADIIKAVNASGLATVWRNQSGLVRVARGFMHLAPKGSPDIVGFTRGGRFVGLEVKLTDKTARAKGETAEAQSEWRQKILAAGGIHGQVLTPEDAIRLLI
jgi:hypothetical protein